MQVLLSRIQVQSEQLHMLKEELWLAQLSDIEARDPAAAFAPADASSEAAAATRQAAAACQAAADPLSAPLPVGGPAGRELVPQTLAKAEAEAPCLVPQDPQSLLAWADAALTEAGVPWGLWNVPLADTLQHACPGGQLQDGQQPSIRGQISCIDVHNGSPRGQLQDEQQAFGAAADQDGLPVCLAAAQGDHDPGAEVASSSASGESQLIIVPVPPGAAGGSTGGGTSGSAGRGASSLATGELALLPVPVPPGGSGTGGGTGAAATRDEFLLMYVAWVKEVSEMLPAAEQGDAQAVANVNRLTLQLDERLRR